MNENELHERYIRLAFQYESAIDALLARGLVDEEAADAAKERFYDTLNEEKLRTTQKVRDYHETISLYMRMLAHDGMVSLTELARQYSDESPGYVIQSWMRSRNTLEFLRQWELEQNAEFDDQVCAELIRQGHTTSLTITPTLWVRRTHAVGLHVKQGKGGGVRAYPEIAADFRLWLDPKERLEIISKKFYRFSDYLGTTSQMSELLGISSISGILRFGRYPAYHGISEPHLAVKSSKTVVENRPYY